MSNGYCSLNDEDLHSDFWRSILDDPILEGANGPQLLPDELNSLSSMSSGSKKRNRDLDPGNSQEANGKVRKKQHRCPGAFYTGESSTFRQQERLKGKTVAGMAKVYKDRISRRIKNDKMTDMEVILRIVCNMTAINASHLLPRVLGSLEQIKTQWPIRPDLQQIKQKIQEIESNYKDDSLTDEAEQRLVEVGDELERLDQKRLKDSTKAGNLDAVFTDFSMRTLQKELSSTWPWLISVVQDQDHESLITGEELQYSTCELENQLCDNDNNKVDVTDFHGLEQALNNIGYKTPDYLKPIATRIENVRGKATDFCHYGIQVLVCAAIKEMEEVSIKELNWDTLKKWAATLNKAKGLDFEVGFANNLLQKNLYSYFCHSRNFGRN
ncbi:hypothetical protein CXB51_029509 [Gossypium anomalum]|uniref:Uncharacterized protein n=1 Tax=Gossypium anomalum TaxID=47600 RepID=A0A8J5YP74_9ROSI|nr:hypothetical protein CXB51_029509 [Gossypium anomalum]